MIRIFSFIGPLLFMLPFSVAAAPQAEPMSLKLTLDYRFSEEPLTTEKIWKLDPAEVNPHRQRWVLQRQVELHGLEAVEISKDLFGVKVESLSSNSTAFIRGDGPWYRPIGQFPCARQAPSDRFATREATREAAETAARLWDRTLRQEKPALELALSRVKANSSPIALKYALQVFDEWYRKVQAGWRAKAKSEALKASWLRDGRLAAAAKVCPAAKNQPDVALPRWESMMEPLVGASAQKFLVRAPARRWNGVFSVRLDIEVADQRLNGQFLIDTSARHSLISPDWLEALGIPLAWLAQSKTPERVYWRGHQGLAHRTSVDRVVMSGKELDMHDFLLFPTEIFSPPDYIASCCDGVLGLDFLAKHAVTFRPGPPNELLVFPGEKFSFPEAEQRWLEAHILEEGGIASECSASFAGGKALRGVLWDTGSPGGLLLSSGMDAQLATHLWELSCGSQPFAENVPAAISERSFTGVNEQKNQFALGMLVLTRGRFTFDLPHGRIWFSKDGIAKPVARNRSGLRVRFLEKGKERILQVENISKATPAAELEKAGLKAGVHILKVDRKHADELDIFEIQQRLSGAYGDKVVLEWQSKTGAPVQSGSISLPISGQGKPSPSPTR